MLFFFTGEAGRNGLAGLPGFKGEYGNNGLNGLPGPDGETGFPGRKGLYHDKTYCVNIDLQLFQQFLAIKQGTRQNLIK